jgi:hypothetical protein
VKQVKEIITNTAKTQFETLSIMWPRLKQPTAFLFLFLFFCHGGKQSKIELTVTLIWLCFSLNSWRMPSVKAVTMNLVAA